MQSAGTNISSIHRYEYSIRDGQTRVKNIRIFSKSAYTVILTFLTMKSLFLAILPLLILASCTNPPTPPTPVTPAPIVPETVDVAAPAALTPFLARGTEPFWIFEQTATGGVYSLPNPLGGIITTLYTTTETMVGPQLVVTATPVSTGASLTVTLTPGSCSDGMSDISYAYSAQLVIGVDTYTGCAN
jgi:uncharacterized membrane protein